VSNSASTSNKAFVLMAFDTLFNQRDYKAAEAYWSPEYIQLCYRFFSWCTRTYTSSRCTGISFGASIPSLT
jgi:hypothetical protein